MKKLILFNSILLLAQITNAQITFQKAFGGTNGSSGYCVRQTTDGGYVVAGMNSSFGSGGNDIYLIRTNPNGDTLWTKTFGGLSDEQPTSLQQTTDGGFIISAYTTSFGAGLYDAYLIKTDVNGDTLWQRTFGSVYEDRAYSVQQTTDGGYIIAGLYRFSVGSDYEVYLIKTDANGDSLWIKNMGDINNDAGRSVQQTSDGGYIIAGYINTTNASDVYLIKLDANGNLVWSKAYGGTGLEAGYSVQQTTDGGYIIGGYTNSFGAGDEDIYLIKTDSIGNNIWTKAFGGSNTDVCNSIQQTSDGGYIIAGSSNSFGAGNNDVYLIRINANGDSLWTKTFGGINGDWGNSVQQTFDGGYIIAGITENYGSGFSNIYLIKTDSLGNSGCNSGNPATIVTSPVTQVINPATVLFSTAAAVHSPITIIKSGCSVNTPCTTVGINEMETNNSFPISPNPSSGNFIISFEGKIIEGRIEILNILGENVYTENIFNESKKEINLKNISEGIYFVKVFDGEKSYCKKLIIE